MNNSTDVLRVEEDGIELFTVIATGESAVSERGLARMSGVDRQTMRRWFSDLAHPGTPKWLHPLTDINLELAHEIKKRWKPIKPISAKAASKFISLVARHLKTDEAFDTLDAIGEIGLNSYIQGKTGWLPDQYQSSTKSRQVIDRILDTPEPWSLMFEKEFEFHLARITKLHKRDIRNSQYYWEFIYNWLTGEERAKLEKINPVLPSGRRKHKIHSCIEQSTKERLSGHILAMMYLMKSANTVRELRRMVQRQYGVDQGDLFDRWD
jgi:hypothetical protein